MSALSALAVPPEVHGANEVLSVVDRCLAAGFARLDPSLRGELQAMARCFGATPLAERVAQSAAAIADGHVTEDALIALAAARESIHGACHDALFGEANRALGRIWRIPPAFTGTPGERDGRAESLATGLRHWLVEVALAGIGQLDTGTVAPFISAVDEIQSHAQLARIAPLVTGFVDELLENTPTAQMSNLPVRRWTDMWARALLAAATPPLLANTEEVGGELRILGAYLNEHDHVASLIAYGALDDRIVKTTVTAWKVDAVTGPEVWSLFDAVAPELVTAIADSKSIELASAKVTEAGDLIWPGDASLGARFDSIEAARELLAPSAERLIPFAEAQSRHPVQLALPIVYQSSDEVALADEWISSELASPATDIESGFGLLRFDGGRWIVQPLRGVDGNKKSKRVFDHSDAIAAARKIKKSASTVAVLQERASKLLRA